MWNGLGVEPDTDLEKPGRVDILLGMDLLPSIYPHSSIIVKHNKLLIIDTKLGQVMGGVAPASDRLRTVPACSLTIPPPHPGSNLLCFWELEELPEQHNTLIVEEQQAVQHFQQTHPTNKEMDVILCPCQGRFLQCSWEAPESRLCRDCLQMREP